MRVGRRFQVGSTDGDALGKGLYETQKLVANRAFDVDGGAGGEGGAGLFGRVGLVGINARAEDSALLMAGGVNIMGMFQDE